MLLAAKGGEHDVDVAGLWTAQRAFLVKSFRCFRWRPSLSMATLLDISATAAGSVFATTLA